MSQPSTDTINVEARDSSHVVTQVGVIHGDATFYNVTPDATAKDKFDTGRKYLNGNMPRKAEQLICEAAHEGYANAEVAYYWVLATLSGRSFDHLEVSEFDQLVAARDMALSHGGLHRTDPWQAALEAILDMIQWLSAQESGADPDLAGTSFSQMLGRYEALPVERRDEIRRHLDMVIAGALQDEIERVDAEEIRRLRMRDHRLRRVPKFFKPIPVEPRLRALVGGADRPRLWITASSGIALLVVAFVLLVLLGAPAHIGGVLVAAALWAGSGYGLIRHRCEELRLEAERREAVARSQSAPDAGLTARQRGVPDRFDHNLATFVDREFARYKPDQLELPAWRSEVSSYRNGLIRDISAQYGYDAAPASPLDLEWLIPWRVKQIVDRWAEKQSLPGLEVFDVRPLTAFLASASRVGLYLGALIAAVSAIRADLGLGALDVLIVGAGVWLTDQNLAAAMVEERRRDADHRDRDRQYEEEQQAYERWVAWIADTPTDDEMGRWLDYDKAYAKSQALRYFSLSNRDLIGHVILTQSDYPCRRARVIYGPPRYSAYRVRIFLLTEVGVREATMRLDFTTGAILDPVYKGFSYDSLTSARVAEVSIRFDAGGERRVEEVERRGDSHDPTQLTFARALFLSQVDQDKTFVLIENFDLGLIERALEDPSRLNDLAQDAAGVTVALRILMSIAADRGRWVDEERNRRRRRLDAFRRSQQRKHPELPQYGNGINLLDGPPLALPGPRPPTSDEVIEAEVIEDE